MRLTQFFFLDAMIEEDRLSLKFRNRFNPPFPHLDMLILAFLFRTTNAFRFLTLWLKGYLRRAVVASYW